MSYDFILDSVHAERIFLHLIFHCPHCNLEVTRSHVCDFRQYNRLLCYNISKHSNNAGVDKLAEGSVSVQQLQMLQAS